MCVVVTREETLHMSQHTRTKASTKFQRCAAAMDRGDYAPCSNSKRRMCIGILVNDWAMKISREKLKLKGRNSIKPRFWLIKRRNIFIQIYIYIYIYIYKYINIWYKYKNFNFNKNPRCKTYSVTAASTLLTNFIEFYSNFQCPHK